MAECLRCGATITDGYVCSREARDLADTLLVAAGHAEDAEAVITRQARYGTGGGSGDEDPLPGDLTAAARFARISNTIGTWTRHLLEETGQTLPRWRRLTGPLCPPTGTRCTHDSCAAIRRVWPFSETGTAAVWLAAHTNQLRTRPEAGEAFRDLERACEDLAKLVDRPDRKRLVGVCDCGRILYASLGRRVIQCRERTCGAVWNVDDGLDILMRHLDDKLFTAGEAAKLAAYLDPDRTQEQIRKLIAAFARRSLVIAHGYVQRAATDAELRDDPEAGPVTVPTYRFGDVRDQLARTPRRHREGAAA